MPVANALIGLGANLGDRLETLEAAVEQLRQTPGIELFRVSPWLKRSLRADRRIKRRS